MAANQSELLISADSHVIESPALWEKHLPAAMRDAAPRFLGAAIFQGQPGGHDPVARLDEMARDGVSAEVLYPTLAMVLYGAIADAALQEACFRVYNDWLAEYCSHSPRNLLGIATISCYNMNNAVRELERSKKKGLRGAMVWQAPPEALPFHSRHYDPLWAAAEEMQMPVSLHILTGFNWSLRAGQEALTGKTVSDDERIRSGEYAFRGVVNYKLLSAMNALHDILLSGVFQRFPKLKFVLVENEIGWLPFYLEQLDKYYHRKPKAGVPSPSEQFNSNCYATFFNDSTGAHCLSWWGARQCMWSSDFPHHNSTWPKSREAVERMLGNLDAATRMQLVSKTVCELYGISTDTL